jgi:hypothetical protein
MAEVAQARLGIAIAQTIGAGIYPGADTIK